jgi:hypothetical protein
MVELGGLTSSVTVFQPPGFTLVLGGRLDRGGFDIGLGVVDDSHEFLEEGTAGSDDVLGELLLAAREVVVQRPKRCIRLGNYLIETCAGVALAAKELRGGVQDALTCGSTSHHWEA